MGFATVLYITAILVSIVFERQERRHRFELELEYDRLSKKLPPAKPKLSILTSWLNVAVGIIMTIIGILMLISQFAVLHIPHALDKQPAVITGAQFELVAVWLATSIALILLGLKSVRQHRRLAKEGSNQ